MSMSEALIGITVYGLIVAVVGYFIGSRLEKRRSTQKSIS